MRNRVPVYSGLHQSLLPHRYTSGRVWSPASTPVRVTFGVTGHPAIASREARGGRTSEAATLDFEFTDGDPSSWPNWWPKIVRIGRPQWMPRPPA
jgi:hypothetical protein